MSTVEIKNEALPIVKAGLSIEKKRLEFNYKKMKLELQFFEKKFKMPTAKFLEQFNNGALGDDQKWFEWLFAYKSQQHIIQKLDLINEINL